MVFPIDLTQWRVYSAEQSVPLGQEFADLDEAATYLWWVQSTQWWKASFPNPPSISVVLGGDSNRAGERLSFAHDDGEGFWTISLHPRMMNATVLLHEVAHCLAPTQFGNLKQIRKGKFDSGRHHDHGEHFRGAFAALAERYRIGVDPQELRRAYLHFELETSSLEEVADARAHSAEVERAYAELWARLERERESDPERIEKRKRMEEVRLAHEAEVALGEEADQGRSSRDWPPSSFWGEWIWFNRSIRFRPRVSQKRLAAEVAQVVRCTARDISRLEWSEEKPESSLDMKRCAAIAAVLRVDPVWAETHRGVAPGSLTLTLEELEPIAIEWVEQIRHLNLLLKERPQRWRAEGDR